MGVKVHPRVMQRHPELSEADVLSAWANAHWYATRYTGDKDAEIAIGADANGRLLEMVAAEDDEGNLVVFHANTPPTKKFMQELGLLGR